MLKLQMSFDCHTHFYGGSFEDLKELINCSPFASKYMCYHCVDFKQMEIEKDLNQDTLYFMMPFVLKETDIEKANKRLLAFSDNKNNIIQFPLLGDELETYKNFKNFGGLKEHFLIHSKEQFEERVKYYDYLNSIGKMLIVHCKDDDRLDYIKVLRRMFPCMYIQIAHLGVNRKDIIKTRKLLNEFQGDGHVYYDISTVFDFDFISEMFPVVKNQILFGTDHPYVKQEELKKQEEFFSYQHEIMNYMNSNARTLITLIGNKV